MCILPFPSNVVLKLTLSENLVEHDFDVVRGVPVAMIVERAGVLQDAVQLNATRPHKLDVGLCRGVPVLEGTFFFRLTPEDLIVAV